LREKKDERIKRRFAELPFLVLKEELQSLWPRAYHGRVQEEITFKKDR